MTPLFTSALERYPARRLATNRGSGRPPERVAPVVDNADNGHDDSADGIPAQISTGSHRGAAPCVPPFERIRRPLPNRYRVVERIGSVPHQAAARNRSITDFPWRRSFRGRYRRCFAPVDGARWLAGTRLTSSTIRCNRDNLLIKLATSDSLKCLVSLKIAINAVP